MSEITAAINQLLVDLFHDILRIEEASLRVGKFHDLTVTEYHVIEAIEPGKGKTMSNTASILGITVGTLTSSIDRLIAKSYVIREKSSTDKRVVFIKLTSKGVAAYEHHKEFHKDMVENIVIDYTEEETEILYEAINKLKVFFDSKKEAIKE